MVGGRPLVDGRSGATAGVWTGEAPPRALPCQTSLVPVGSRTATLRVTTIPRGPHHDYPAGSLDNYPTDPPTAPPCGPLHDYPAGSPPASHDDYPTDRAPPRGPLTASHDEYPTDGTLHDLRADLATTTLQTDPSTPILKVSGPHHHYPTDGPLHDLRADHTAATLRTPSPIPLGFLHAYPMDLTLPGGSPHETPAGPPTPTLRISPPDLLDDPRLPQGDPFIQTPPPKKIRPLRGWPPPEGGRNLPAPEGGRDVVPRVGLHKARLRVRSLPC